VSVVSAPEFGAGAATIEVSVGFNALTLLS